MYVLPNSKDRSQQAPGVGAAIQDIRALPCDAGSVLSWAPETLHWGSGSSQWATSPRISFATYLARADMPETNTSVIKLDASQPLSFDFRIGNIGRTIAKYGQNKLAGHDPDRDNVYPKELQAFCAQYQYCKPQDKGFVKPDFSVLKPGRNDHCPCGSGKKYKRCHGK